MFENEAWDESLSWTLSSVELCLFTIFSTYYPILPHITPYHIHDTVQCYMFKIHGYVSVPSLVIKIMTYFDYYVQAYKILQDLSTLPMVLILDLFYTFRR